jgi:hypothetical protein
VPKPRVRWTRLLPFGALAVLLLLRVAGASPPATTPTPAPAPKAKSAPTGAAPQKVTVGLYLQNIPEIDIKTNSFQAEFFLWLVWNGEIDPTLTMELTNLVNVTDLAKIPVFMDEAGNAKADTLPDGSKIQQFHVYGRFGHPFPLNKYPFDDHEITISIEDSRHDVRELVYEIDVKGTTKRPELIIPGWTLSPVKTALTESKFATAFGDTRANHDEERYSHAAFGVHIFRPVVGIISKTVIPIAIIILITFGAFFCQPQDIDARLCLTITALISAVALQFTAATELPPTGSLLLLDKIYILSYVAILGVTFSCIASNRAVHRERPALAASIDRWGLVAHVLGYFGALTYFVMRAI